MWIVVPSTCFPSAPAPEDWTSESDSLFQSLASSVAWNTKHRPASSWRSGWKRDALIRRLCGLIYEPSTAARGVESWISSLAASRVSRGASPASEPEPTTRGTSGPTRSESFSNAGLDGSLSKTWAASFGMDTDDLSSPTLKALATGLRRSSSRRQPSARPTDANGSSSWPTATAEDAESSQARRPGDVTLTEAMRSWSTPGSHDGRRPGSDDGSTQAVRSHPDPATLPDGAPASSDTPNWLPPLTLRWMFEQFSKQHSGGLFGLLSQVAIEGSAGVRRVRLPRDCWLESLSLASSKRKRLNPLFVEWLMGWPINLTSLVPLDSGSPATAWSRYKQQQRGAFSALDSRTDA